MPSVARAVHPGTAALCFILNHMEMQMVFRGALLCAVLALGICGGSVEAVGNQAFPDVRLTLLPALRNAAAIMQQAEGGSVAALLQVRQQAVGGAPPDKPDSWQQCVRQCPCLQDSLAS